MNEMVAMVDDPRFAEHRARGPHPEQPARLSAARAGAKAALDDDATLMIEAPHATRDLLERVHTASYLGELDRSLEVGWGNLDADTFCSPGTREAALRAAGGAAALASALMDGRARRGVALLRPPGHHAEADRAMGFCLLNNVAVAAEAAIAAGAERVAIVDWDVHHGNGTQHAFEDRADVLFVSLHQFPFYPGTGPATDIGKGAGTGHTLNIAFPGACGDAAYGEAFRRAVLPALRSHRPDIVLVSAGYDAHAQDPLASMELSTEAYGAMTTAIVDVAEALGHGRVGFLLEGGYDLQALEASVHATLRAAQGERVALPEGRPRAAAADAIEAAVRAHERAHTNKGDR